jgi:predicted nucleic acid-binding Zn ribbon protein
MNEHLVPKIIQCTCGNAVESVFLKTWCQECCRPIFYHEKDSRRDRLNSYYMTGVIAFAIMLMAYFVIELAFPMFG